jgi:hypothetical protein
MEVEKTGRKPTKDAIANQKLLPESNFDDGENEMDYWPDFTLGDTSADNCPGQLQFEALIAVRAGTRLSGHRPAAHGAQKSIAKHRHKRILELFWSFLLGFPT